MQKHYQFSVWENALSLAWAAELQWHRMGINSCKLTADNALPPIDSSEKPPFPLESKPLYTIIMPPPNVTGSLHLGHAMSSTIQDVLVRSKKMQGFDTCWIPGLDHASIATQMMVEKDLMQEGLTRQDLGREAFIKRVWCWKEHHGNSILHQMRRLGFGANWDRLCFTLDSGPSTAVKEAFIQLFKTGLIYRAQRLVNWDNELKTAVSDLEVLNKSEKGSLWTIRYEAWKEPQKTEPTEKSHDIFCPEQRTEDEITERMSQETARGDALFVATSRPETLFGDVAVAVHPEDTRYSHWIGAFVTLPLVGKKIPVIADDAVDPEKGTGVVKITPCHDFVDEAVAKRHGLRGESLFNESGLCIEPMPKEYLGLDVPQSRQKTLTQLYQKSCLWKQENVTHNMPYSERSGTLIQPRITYQWFVDVAGMAEKSLQAVAEGDTCFIPEEWRQTYDHWLKNIQPWCISRQLWWGHRIPVWYGPEGSVFVAHTAQEAYSQAKKIWPEDVVLQQDEDVLDTWFSSGLWPFSVLGWPNSQETKARDVSWHHQRYPTNVLVTGFDIIFFWVARMMMMSMQLTGCVPFKEVYVHPLVQDAKGQKMSKTKKNVVDPLMVVNEYGADALRWSLMHLLTGKPHVRFKLEDVKNGQHFLTKIWNLFRFLQAKGLWGPETNRQFLHTPISLRGPLNQWFAAQLEDIAKRVKESLDTYRFQDMALALQKGVWNIYCDWYLEWAKGACIQNDTAPSPKILNTESDVLWGSCPSVIQFIEMENKENNDFIEETRHCLTWGAGVLLRLLHPVIPFITQYLWTLFFLPEEQVEMWGQNIWENTDAKQKNPQETKDAHTAQESDKKSAQSWKATDPKAASNEGASTPLLVPSLGQGLNPAPWPEFSCTPCNAVTAMEWIMAVVPMVRRIRTELSLGQERVPMTLSAVPENFVSVISCYKGFLCQLLHLSAIHIHTESLNLEGQFKGVVLPIGDSVMALSLEGREDHWDQEGEINRLRHCVEKGAQEIEVCNQSLKNVDFLKKAPEEIVEGLRHRKETTIEMIKIWQAILQGLTQ